MIVASVAPEPLEFRDSRLRANAATMSHRPALDGNSRAIIKCKLSPASGRIRVTELSLAKVTAARVNVLHDNRSSIADGPSDPPCNSAYTIHGLDRVGVGGSKPLAPTKQQRAPNGSLVSSCGARVPGPGRCDVATTFSHACRAGRSCPRTTFTRRLSPKQVSVTLEA